MPLYQPDSKSDLGLLGFFGLLKINSVPTAALKQQRPTFLTRCEELMEPLESISRQRNIRGYLVFENGWISH